MNKLVIALSLLSINGCFCQMIEFNEDNYVQQAPQEITQRVQEVSALINFTKSYEVATPKKAGMQINPWNKFISYGINPLTKNTFLIINPAWFSTLTKDEQTFLIGRSLVTLQGEVSAMPVKIIPYLFMMLAFFLLFLFYWLLQFTPLAQQKKWIRMITAVILLNIVQYTIVGPLQQKLTIYFTKQYDMNVIHLTIKKTGNKSAALQALKKFDQSIKEEYQKGEVFFAPHITLFEGYVNQLH